jgi:putative spermidine/putrescine transport system permease protein
VDDAAARAVGAGAMTGRPPRWLWPFALVVYALLLAPLVVVAVVSFGATATFDFPPRGLSLRWYRAFFASEMFLRAFRVSQEIGFLTALVAMIAGTVSAIGLVRLRFRGRQAIETFFLSPLLVPHILLGAAVYLYLARLAWPTSSMTLLVGHIVIATPYAIRSVTAGLIGMDPRLEEAAMSLGATRVQAFVKVTLPLLRSSLVSAAVFAFIISFSDINLALFLAGANAPSLPVHIFSQIQFEADPSIAAASALQIVIVGGLIVLVQRLFRLRLMV